jgi:hypothetical protein
MRKAAHEDESREKGKGKREKGKLGEMEEGGM